MKVLDLFTRLDTLIEQGHGNDDIYLTLHDDARVDRDDNRVGDTWRTAWRLDDINPCDLPGENFINLCGVPEEDQ